MAVVLVTGERGFVGRAVLRELIEAGHDAHGTDVMDGGPDLRDADGLDSLLCSVRPEIVFHLAAISDVGSSWEDPRRTFAVNALGTVHLVEAAIAAGVRRIVVASSAEVYGCVEPVEGGVPECHDLRPSTPYGSSKAAAEMVALQAGSRVEVVRARGFTHIGPGQQPGRMIPAVARRIRTAAAEGSRHIAVGNLTPVRDYTHVDDVARAYLRLAEAGVPGEAYNVCSGQGRSVADVIDALAELIGHDVEPLSDPALIRSIDTPWLVGDPSKLRADTGWRPERSLEDALEDLAATL